MKTIITSIALLSGIVAFAQENPKKDTLKVQNIEEISMTKKVFQKKADRLIFDVAASPIAKGNTAFNLLKETPLVSSTDDKTLKIAGKSNAVIYLNGRKTQMNSDALEAFLKNTPAENIQKIEVITLPGSEFNVESSDGIINIVLKKKMSDGMNGNFRVSNTQTKYNSQSSAASLNYRKGKFGANANLSYSNNYRIQDYTLKNGDLQNKNTSIGSVMNNDRDFGGYLNLDYALTEKQNLGLSYNFWFSKTAEAWTDLFSKVEFMNSLNQPETLYNRTQNAMSGKDRNNSVNLNYEIKLDDTGSKLYLNAAYLNFTKDEFNANKTSNVNAENEFLSWSGKFNQKTPQTIDNISGNADFTKVFKGFTLGAGGNFNKTKTDNDTYFERLNLTNNIFEKDQNQSNHFIYDEKIGGVYLNLEKNFSDKFSGKIGARMEFTNSFGEILGTNINVDRNYNNILPTLSLNYNINDKNSLSYAFTSRVRRPSFWEINPVRIYLTEVNYIQNNPFMKASSVYNQELMYMYKNAYFLQVSNSYKNDAITQVPLQKTINGKQTLRYIRTNFGSENQLSINLGMNKSFFNQIWNANYVIGLQVNAYKGNVDTDPITNETFSPYIFDYSLATPFFQMSNNIRLSSKKDWFLGISYFYLGKSRTELGTLKPLQQLDFSLKKLWIDWTFALDLRDVLKTNKVIINDEQPNGNFNFIDQYQYSRRASVSITYNFGNKKLQKIRKMDSAADDIKSRTGN